VYIDCMFVLLASVDRGGVHVCWSFVGVIDAVLVVWWLVLVCVLVCMCSSIFCYGVSLWFLGVYLASFADSGCWVGLMVGLRGWFFVWLYLLVGGFVWVLGCLESPSPKRRDSTSPFLHGRRRRLLDHRSRHRGHRPDRAWQGQVGETVPRSSAIKVTPAEPPSPVCRDVP